MMVMSPYAKGGGYSNTIRYTHSSLLRSLEEIFNVTPMLGDAANSNDLGDLFASVSSGPKKPVYYNLTAASSDATANTTQPTVETPTSLPTQVPTKAPTATMAIG